MGSSGGEVEWESDGGGGCDAYFLERASRSASRPCLNPVQPFHQRTNLVAHAANHLDESFFFSPQPNAINRLDVMREIEHSRQTATDLRHDILNGAKNEMLLCSEQLRRDTLSMPRRAALPDRREPCLRIR